MSDNFSTNMTISIGFSCLIIIIGLGFASINNDDSPKEYQPNPFLKMVDESLLPIMKDVQSNPIHIFNYPIILAMLAFLLFPPFMMYGGLYYTAWLPSKIYNKIKASQKLSEVREN